MTRDLAHPAPEGPGIIRLENWEDQLEILQQEAHQADLYSPLERLRLLLKEYAEAHINGLRILGSAASAVAEVEGAWVRVILSARPAAKFRGAIPWEPLLTRLDQRLLEGWDAALYSIPGTEPPQPWIRRACVLLERGWCDDNFDPSRHEWSLEVTMPVEVLGPPGSRKHPLLARPVLDEDGVVKDGAWALREGVLIVRQRGSVARLFDLHSLPLREEGALLEALKRGDDAALSDALPLLARLKAPEYPVECAGEHWKNVSEILRTR